MQKMRNIDTFLSFLRVHAKRYTSQTHPQPSSLWTVKMATTRSTITTNHSYFYQAKNQLNTSLDDSQSHSMYYLYANKELLLGSSRALINSQLLGDRWFESNTFSSPHIHSRTIRIVLLPPQRSAISNPPWSSSLLDPCRVYNIKISTTMHLLYSLALP